MDDMTKEQRHKNMQHIRSKDTEIERTLRHVLWNRGYRYRKNYTKLPGKPDIVLTKYKIAVFCDSEFFHGKDFNTKKPVDVNHEYWHNKISRNIERDKNVNHQLKDDGWIVIRFWGKDILKDLEHCADIIQETINRIQR